MNITEKAGVRHSCSSVKTVLKSSVEGSSVPCQYFFTSPGYSEFCAGSGGRSREGKVSAVLFQCMFYPACLFSLLLGHAAISIDVPYCHLVSRPARYWRSLKISVELPWMKTLYCSRKNASKTLLSA